MNKRFVCQHCACTYPDFDVAHVCSQGPYAPKLKPKINERIRELLEQAGVKFVVMPNDTEYEKFAELIIKEMLQTCEDHPTWTGRMIGEQIKQHFGIEL